MSKNTPSNYEIGIGKKQMLKELKEVLEFDYVEFAMAPIAFIKHIYRIYILNEDLPPFNWNE